MMRRRVLTFLLAGLVVLGSVLSCLPLRTSAIVPLGFVQSALASYASGTGYKLYNDNGTGQDILGSLGELYDDYVTVSNKTITGQLANLAFLANSSYIYQDSSGQIVISKVAADIFQDFADWIQTEYNVTVGSDTPTQVVASTVSGYTFPSYSTTGTYNVSSLVDSTSFYHWCISQSPATFVLSDSVANDVTAFLRSHSGQAISMIIYNKADWSGGGSSPITIIARPATVGSNINLTDYADGLELQSYGVGNGSGTINISSTTTRSGGRVFIGQRTTEYYLYASNLNVTEVSGAAGLGVTLAQAVADVIGQAKEDDAVVIGVGASAGATAQDIADMVAQGVKAQTLDPSVSITAESVIDTPVQPYPDIDGLGLPELGAALVSRFPFCIPWDFVDTVKLLNAEPVAPDIAVDLFPAAFKSKVGVTGSTEFRINLGDEKYQKIGTFCRWGSLIGFCFGLAMLTKRMIWTA